MAARIPAREVALDAEWLPHAFEPDGQHLTAVFVPRELRANLLFLTDGQFRGAYRKATFAVDALTSACAAAPRAPIHFIFNTSFCCSTLLAKALEVPGLSASLKEPNILVNVAERLIGGDTTQSNTELELALRLLERPFTAGEKVIAKPSNFANRLLDPILELRPESRALLLYSDAATFLRSIVKRGLVARINARRLYQNVAAWTSLDFGFSGEDIFQQTDLQIAALAWLMQIAHFQAIADRLGPERVMVVDAADLLADPANMLRQIQVLFGLGLDEGRIAAIVDGPVFAKHSKFSEVNYNERTRERDHKALSKVHEEELGMVLQWLDAVAGHCGVSLRPHDRS
jgi:hypothetical protein